jgi:hypothetical protein
MDAKANIEAVKVFGTLYKKDFERWYDNDCFNFTSMTLKTARKVWGENDPRYVELRSYGALGKATNSYQVANVIDRIGVNKACVRQDPDDGLTQSGMQESFERDMLGGVFCV